MPQRKTPPVDRECVCGVIFQVRYKHLPKKYCTPECERPFPPKNTKCLWCREKLPPNRPRIRSSYCNDSCANLKRWADHRKAKHLEALGLKPRKPRPRKRLGAKPRGPNAAPTPRRCWIVKKTTPHGFRYVLTGQREGQPTRKTLGSTRTRPEAAAAREAWLKDLTLPRKRSVDYQNIHQLVKAGNPDLELIAA